ncbi:tRNA (guanine-N(1)-)-methyltransferase [Bacilli bacterium]|nr:tRNA (guanine-N(1)-)-methyltransferase [Bacilli bacterium]
MESNLWNLKVVDIRDYSQDKHGRVDDTPFGGGRGMVMRADVIGNVLDNNVGRNTKICCMSPRGKVINQTKIAEMAQLDDMALLCGRYEGIDQRVIDEYDMEELSLGDFVMMGGEVAALALIESVARYVGGLIKTESLEEDSFGAARNNIYRNLLEYPLYTRPQEWRNREVPEILLSGHHENIKKWRFQQAEDITKRRRPDLYKKYLEENL